MLDIEFDEKLLRAATSQNTLEENARLFWQLNWNSTVLPHQVPPPGDWTIWLLMAGRGAGKTRTAAETVGGWAADQPNTRWLVAAPTHDDLVKVCFEGVSGLTNVIPPELIVPTKTGSLWDSTDKCMTLVNGSMLFGVSAETPKRFRGPEYHGGWLDEFAQWQYPQDAFDTLMLSMRLGKKPRLLITTTPRPLPTIRSLVTEDGNRVAVTRASTYANLNNLAPAFRDTILKYEGTQIGRQEIHAELLDPDEQGIIKRSWFSMWPAKKELPQFSLVVLSLDTAFSEQTRDKKTGDRDPTACIVLGLFRENNREGIILLDCWEEMLGFPDLIDRVPKELNKHYGQHDKPLIESPFGPSLLNSRKGRKPDVLIIEDKGSGISLRQMLSREGIPAYPYNPGKASKLERLHAISHVIANGMLYLVESDTRAGEFRTWYQPFIDQVCAFSGDGTTEHDDFVDCLSQGLRYIVDRNLIRITAETASEQREAPRLGPKPNPYAQ